MIFEPRSGDGVTMCAKLTQLVVLAIPGSTLYNQTPSKPLELHVPTTASTQPLRLYSKKYSSVIPVLYSSILACLLTCESRFSLPQKLSVLIFSPHARYTPPSPPFFFFTYGAFEKTPLHLQQHLHQEAAMHVTSNIQFSKI